MTYRVRCKRRRRNDGRCPTPVRYARWIRESVNRNSKLDRVWHKNLNGHHESARYRVESNEAWAKYHANEVRPTQPPVRRAWPAVSRKDAERAEMQPLVDLWDAEVHAAAVTLAKSLGFFRVLP